MTTHAAREVFTDRRPAMFYAAIFDQPAEFSIPGEPDLAIGTAWPCGCCTYLEQNSAGVWIARRDADLCRGPRDCWLKDM